MDSANPAFGHSLLFDLVANEVDSKQYQWEQCEDEHAEHGGQTYWRNRVTGEFRFDAPPSPTSLSPKQSAVKGSASRVSSRLAASSVASEDGIDSPRSVRSSKVLSRISSRLTHRVASSSSDAAGVAPSPEPLVAPSPSKLRQSKSYLRKSNKLAVSKKTTWQEVKPCFPSLSNVREKNVDSFFQTDALAQVEFPINSTSLDELEVAAVVMLERMLPSTQVPLTFDLLADFVHRARTDLYSTYKNPYHDFRHAVDGMQFMFFLLNQADVFEQLLGEELTTFILLVVCLTQDGNHDGLTNKIHVERNTALVAEFGADSPLERMHFSHLEQLLRDCHILDQVQDQNKFLTKCKSLMLCTDMSRHKKLMAQFLDAPTASSVFYLLMKLADVSNTCRNFDEARAWALRLDAETKLNGSYVGSTESLSRSVVEFSTSIVLPLLGAMGELGMRETELELKERVQVNITKWNSVGDVDINDGL